MAPPRTKKPADKHDEDGKDEDKGGRQVNLAKLNGRLSARVAGLVNENEALQLIIEEQDETIAGLRAELVAATSGSDSGG